MENFREHIAAAYLHLAAVSEQSADLPFREGGWTRKEILGHLIDSALNNHQRFVRASLDGSYQGPTYEQQGWVKMHDYQSMDWRVLLEHWRLQNELLAAVVERVPENRLSAPCRVGGGDPVTLKFLIEDYLAHLDGHVKQIVS